MSKRISRIFFFLFCFLNVGNKIAILVPTDDITAVVFSPLLELILQFLYYIIYDYLLLLYNFDISVDELWRRMDLFNNFATTRRMRN